MDVSRVTPILKEQTSEPYAQGAELLERVFPDKFADSNLSSTGTMIKADPSLAGVFLKLSLLSPFKSDLARRSHAAFRCRAFDFCLDQLLFDQRRISRRLLHQNPVRRAPLHRSRQIFALEQCRHHTRRERIATARTVGNRNVLAQRRLIHLPFEDIVQHRAPGNHVGVHRATPLRADERQVRIIGGNFFHRLLVRRDPFLIRRIGIDFGFVPQRIVQIANRCRRGNPGTA